VKYTPKICTYTGKDESYKNMNYLAAHFLIANSTTAMLLYSFNAILSQMVHDTGPEKQGARNFIIIYDTYW